MREKPAGEALTDGEINVDEKSNDEATHDMERRLVEDAQCKCRGNKQKQLGR